MSNLLKLSESASLAFHALALLARSPERRFSNAEIAEVLHASPNTLSKVMQRLVKAELAGAAPGPRGGFALGERGSAVHLLEIYEAIEGPLGNPCCLLGTPACDGHGCVLGGLVESVHLEVRRYFEKTTLADLAKSVALGEIA